MVRHFLYCMQFPEPKFLDRPNNCNLLTVPKNYKTINMQLKLYVSQTTAWYSLSSRTCSEQGRSFSTALSIQSPMVSLLTRRMLMSKSWNVVLTYCIKCLKALYRWGNRFVSASEFQFSYIPTFTSYSLLPYYTFSLRNWCYNKGYAVSCGGRCIHSSTCCN